MTAENRIKGMIAIRDCVRTLIEYQTEDYSDAEIQAEQVRLNELYDDLLAAQNEKNYYRNECRLLKSENERLKEQLRKCCSDADTV